MFGNTLFYIYVYENLILLEQKPIRRLEECSDLDVFEPNIKEKEEEEEEARDYISRRNDRKKLTRGKRRLTRWCEKDTGPCKHPMLRGPSAGSGQMAAG
uniref:Uncharacterized protein n=1 Tax=Vespula pensylvanica TaxID=30213 RepID=A0A834UGM3_VESPE|nr:hypothetical protein H0235_000996 [Vespula pensylvanica]